MVNEYRETPMKVATWAALVIALVAMVMGYIAYDISTQTIWIARNVFGIAGVVWVFLFLLDLGFHGEVREYVSFLAVAFIVIACWLLKSTSSGYLVPAVLANGWVEAIICIICGVVIMLLAWIGDPD
jgi:hypothetical protein